MIGRAYERLKLDDLLLSQQAELLAVIGRRRVGKTFLIREHFKDQMVFEFTGTQHARRKNQLKKFALKLDEYRENQLQAVAPGDWMEAFEQLTLHLQGLRKSKRKSVIFFDELPWLSGRRSGFLKEFAYWWNNWASRQHLVVVICGSAASWMIDKVVNNKGGLHNRITEYIALQPFTLSEVKQYLISIKAVLDDYQIIQLYMSIGGIPFYLQHVQRGESATQIINRLCFHKGGVLRNEFNNLYAALYDGHERHIAVVRALATKWKGLTRQEIIKITKFTNGGALTQILTELSSSSFITAINPFGKKRKETLYRLVDEYSLFYLTFIEGERSGNKDIWLSSSREQKYKTWRGYAFENICIKHVEAIKIDLGISGILTEVSGYRSNSSSEQEGVQIDMLIDRSDQCINLCEMKFYNSEITLTKEEADRMRQRRSRFQEQSKTKKSIFNTMITTYGINQNQHSLGQIDQCVTMKALFLLDSFG